MTLKAPITPRLEHPDAERVRRNHEERIKELQTLPSAALRVIQNVQLLDSMLTPIHHGLGRLPVWVGISVVRGAIVAISTGHILEIRDSAHDRSSVVVLKAEAWGATVTVDVAVM